MMSLVSRGNSVHFWSLPVEEIPPMHQMEPCIRTHIDYCTPYSTEYCVLSYHVCNVYSLRSQEKSPPLVPPLSPLRSFSHENGEWGDQIGDEKKIHHHFFPHATTNVRAR
jgi:hypothetical protein